MGVKGNLEVTMVPAPGRSRGCAEVGGTRMVLTVSPASRFSLSRLCKLFEHEALHILGFEHDWMSEEDYWSLGGLPEWGHGLKIRRRSSRR